MGGGLCARPLYCVKNMKKSIKLFLIVSILFPTFCLCQSKLKLEVGYKIDKKFLSDSSNNIILTHPSQYRPYFNIVIDSVKYTIAYDKENLEIKYIYTNDKKFKTSHGLKIGQKISLTKDEVLIYPNWNIYSKKSDDGWFPIIGSDLPDIILKKDTIKMNPITKNSFNTSKYETFKILGFSKGGN